MDKELLKKEAAEKAVEFVKSGMVLGLGTGSTVHYALVKLGELISGGKLKNIVGIPTSEATRAKAEKFGIPITDFEHHQVIDLTIDGADEVDENLNLIKGGGGALLREKIVAQASGACYFIVDESKLSKRLGEKWAVPIEVIKFAYKSEERFLRAMGGEPKLRITENGEPFLTDENNFILDTNFGIIENPYELAQKLNERAGIVEHGLFIGLTTKVIVARNSGVEIFSSDA
jgi:ribose 5-phosphate isomerase A